MIHVNEVLALSDIQNMVFSDIKVLCGASEYGSFSAHLSPFFGCLCSRKINRGTAGPREKIKV